MVFHGGRVPLCHYVRQGVEDLGVVESWNFFDLPAMRFLSPQAFYNPPKNRASHTGQSLTKSKSILANLHPCPSIAL